METSAAVLEQLNSPLTLRNLKIPNLKDGQVLVKIAYAGICHSQVNEIEGKRGPDAYLPHTLGHEASGVVLEVGKGVTKVREGDQVVLSWLKGSGADVPSTHYYCGDNRVNSGAISTFMSHAVVSENRLIPVPKALSLVNSALLGCALPTGMGIVFNNLRAEKGKAFAIFGLGGIGLSALIAAKLSGASKIVAIDIFESKLKVAKALGATEVINASSPDAALKIEELAKGVGVDYSIEAAGNKEAMQNAFSVANKNKGVCVIAGNIKHDEKIAINPFDLIMGKQIVGSWGGGSRIDDDIAKYSKLLIDEKIDLSPLVSHIFPLSEINQAIDKLKKGEVIRALIKM